MATSVREKDIKRVSKILRVRGYSYDQSNYLIAEARKRIGLKPPKRKRGSIERLKKDELEALLEAAYTITRLKIRLAWPGYNLGRLTASMLIS